MKYFAATFLVLFLCGSAQAFTYYQKGQSPSELLNKGNRYQQKNIYNTNDNLNGYSTFQDPYDKNSVRNNANQYGYKVQTYDNQKQGIIAPQINSQNSITNPYGKYGNAYGTTHPSNAYKPQKWNNPYSTAQNPYAAKSFRNDRKWGLQLKDSNGNSVGYHHQSSFKANSIFNTYEQSPYKPNSVQNPYGGNKRFN